MNETIKMQLQSLGLNYLSENWDNLLKATKRRQPSYYAFLTSILEKEYTAKQEKTRLSRINRARIPDKYIMETFPFSRQAKLKKRLIMDLYDSLRYLTEKQDLIFIGPTGCGKTGLATSFLIHAINQGYRGYFIEFHNLIEELRSARGDYSLSRVLKRLIAYDILLIDEFGYENMEKDVAGSFFDLLKARHTRGTTLVTTQLGFEEWNGILKNKHITAALIDRITVNCTVFNMKDCISIRPKKVVYASEK